MRIILLIVFVLPFGHLMAQGNSKDYAVMLSASIQESPASITLKWPADASNGVKYSVYRKSKGTYLWTDSLATLDSSATQYIDNTVSLGKVYEYAVRKRKPALTAYTVPQGNPQQHPFATGYITAGMKVPEVESRGKMILLVDANYTTPLATEIMMLENDLIGDGWQIIRHDIARSATVASVKSKIADDVTNNTGVNALFLLGHIPVPYSGSFSTTTPGASAPPDGHPEHGGAWPADVYYGVMNEAFWTDNATDDLTPARSQNKNALGDGKFDQDYILGDSCILQIGRVDFFNMPAFGIGDTALTSRYLNKLHLFKTGMHKAERRSLVTDNFGPMSGEAFASSAYRAFSTMFGDSVTTIGGSKEYFSIMRDQSYLWSYGTGAGTYTSAGGVGNTNDFVNDSLLNVFTMLFGSYFGDWDSQDNFLRAPLAHKGWTLTCSWSGRPYSIMHPMALGENIGYCMRLSQNNVDRNFWLNPKLNSGYSQNFSPTFIHQSLMGDPSLRLHPVLPVSNLSLSTINQQRHVKLSWNRSADNVLIYKVYRSDARNGVYTLLSSVAGSDSTLTDFSPLNGVNYYMVRAIKLEFTPSGSYFNPSIGIMDTISARKYVGMDEPGKGPQFALYPNPSQGWLQLEAAPEAGENLEIKLFDLGGRMLVQESWARRAGDRRHSLSLQGLPNGVYFVQLQGSTGLSTQKLILLK